MSARKAGAPLRTCIVCGMKTSKRDLMRVVAGADGAALLDPSGRLAGRGTYICKRDECVQTPLSRGKLEHALRTTLNDKNWSLISSDLDSLARSSN